MYHCAVCALSQRTVWLWEDSSGVTHQVELIEDPFAKAFNGLGHEYVGLKTTDEARYHTAIAQRSSLIPARFQLGQEA